MVRNKLLIATAAVLLNACGGGGDSGSAPAPSPAPAPAPVSPPAGPYDLNAAYRELLRGDRSWSLTGLASDGRAVQALLRVQALSDAKFPRSQLASMKRSSYAWEISVGSAAPTTRERQHFYALPEFPTLSGSVAHDGRCVVSTQGSSHSQSAQIGQTGEAVSDGYQLSVCDPPVAADAYFKLRWSLQADGSTALLCHDWDDLTLSLQPAGSEQLCVEVAPDGRIGSRVRANLNLGGGVSVQLRG